MEGPVNKGAMESPSDLNSQVRPVRVEAIIEVEIPIIVMEEEDLGVLVEVHILVT